MPFPVKSLALALYLLPGLGLAAVNPVQQFEQNQRHLAYVPKPIPAFSVDLHQRIIVMPRYQAGSFYVSAGQSLTKATGGHRKRPVQGGSVAKVSMTGALLWKTTLPNIVMTEPVVTPTRVIVGLGGNRMFFHNFGYGCYSPFPHAWVGLSVRTGRVRWTYATHCQDMPTPFLAGNLVIGPTGGGRVIALNAQTGKLVWQLPVSGWSAMSSPVVAGDTFYVGINGTHPSDNRMYAIDWRTHRIRWATHIPEATNLSEASPVVGDGLVFTAYMERAQANSLRVPRQNVFPDWTFQVEALNTQTGQPEWIRYLYTEYAEKPVGFWKNLDLFGRILYQGFLGGLAQTFPRDGINHYLVGEAPGKKHPGIHNPPLTYWKGILFVEPRTGDRLYALAAATGKILWSVPTLPTIANPAIHRGRLYTVSMTGNLMVLRAKTGDVLFRRQLPLGGVGPTEVLLDKTGFVVGDALGRLRSFPYPPLP